MADVIKFNDVAARTYDELMLKSPLAQIIRRNVHQKLLRHFKPGDYVLDLNCGTGTDAVFLAQNGIRVMATDISPKMIRAARNKIDAAGACELVEARVMRNEDVLSLKTDSVPKQSLGTRLPPRGFDGVLSNFNGLNYLEDLDSFAHQLSEVIKPGAKLFFLLLNKLCAAEFFHYMLNLKPGLAFRKLAAREKTFETKVKLYYPSAVKKIFSNHFRVRKITGFGIIIPPDQFKRLYRFNWLMKNAARVERIVSSTSPFYMICDQYLVEMERSV
jgi:SAM-dependent methyltransferase